MEQEMERIVTVIVCLYGDQSSKIKVQASVQSDHMVSVESVFTRVCKTIGLHESSWPLFTLVEGATQPIRKLSLNNMIPLPSPDLCLRKWTFGVEQEKTLLVDQVAMEMLFKHANYNIQSGLLCPDEVNSKKLEECLEPNFQVDAQYVSVCHGLPDYDTEYFQNCVLRTPYARLELPVDSVIDLHISTRGLHCTTANNTKHDNIPWTAVKRWSHSSDHTTFKFDLILLGSDLSLCFHTPQTRFMLAVILEIVKILQGKRRGDVLYFTSDIRREVDHVIWENLLYEPGSENPVFIHSPTTPTHDEEFPT